MVFLITKFSTISIGKKSCLPKLNKMSNEEYSLQNFLSDESIESFDYNLVENATIIGKGGFGEVKRAYVESLGYVALKSLYRNSEFHKYFMKEVCK